MSRAPSVLLGVLAAGLALAAPAAAQKHYKDLTFPPLPELAIPDVHRETLPNGLTLFLLEDHSLPKVEGFALIRTGSRYEPAEKVGLAGIVGQVMRTGGSERLAGEEIDRRLENLGAVVETSIGVASGRASLFALREDLPTVVEILAEILRRPAFPEDKIELAKVQERTAIARRNDDVAAIAGREFRKLLYGPDSPYARTTEYRTIDAIEREDLVAFHRRYFHPNQILLGLWGDFDTAEARELVVRHFGDWPSATVDLPPPPSVPEHAAAEGRVYFIEKDDVNQTNLRIGHLDGRFDDPDFFALTVMSEVLGGGFSSRLFRRIRSELGLAYTAAASWQAGWDYPGTFLVYCNTKSESTVAATREILEEIRKITEEPVTEEELRVAKDGILNSFVFNFDNEGEIVRRLMTYEYYGYPRDFLERYRENVERVRAEDVLAAARRRIRPGDLVILAVGRDDDFDEPLSVLGEVRTIDIAIPPPPSAGPAPPPAASPAELREAEAALARALEAAGGRDALARLRDVTMTTHGTLETPGGPVPMRGRIELVAPDRYRQEARLPFGTMIAVVAGESAWVQQPDGTTRDATEERAAIWNGLVRSYLGLLWTAARGEAVVRGGSTGDGELRVALEVRGEPIEASLDPETGLLRKLEYTSRSLSGATVREERVFREFRSFGPFVLPTESAVYQNGHPVAEGTIDAYRIDEGIPASRFDKPASP